MKQENYVHRLYIALKQLQLHPAEAPGDNGPESLPTACRESARLIPTGVWGTAAPSRVFGFLIPGWSSPWGLGFQSESEWGLQK